MRRMINGAIWLVGLVVLLVVYFLVPLGRYTLFEHTLRIARTEPAQELGAELSEASEAVADRAEQEWDAREAARTEANGGVDPKRIEIDDHGAITVGGEAIEIGELRDRLRALHRTVDDARAIIDATEDAPRGTLDEIDRVLREEDVARDPAAH
ncbi:MAG: ExbD/TolR family protein [Sandaracinaceae bacterium]